MPRARRALARQGGEDGGLQRGEGRVVVGGGEMGHHARQPERAVRRGQLTADGERVGRDHAPAAHAGVGLDVDAAGHAGGPQPGVVLERGNDDLEASGLRLLARLEWREHDDRRPRSERLTQLTRLLQRRAADPFGSGRDRSARAFDGSVGIAVGLDHRPQPAPAGGLDQPPCILMHGAQVHLQRRARHASRRPSGSSRSVATIAPASATAMRAIRRSRAGGWRTPASGPAPGSS